MPGCLCEGGRAGPGAEGVEVSTRGVGESELESDVSMSSGSEELVQRVSSQLSTSDHGEEELEEVEVREDVSSDSMEVARPG